MSTVDDALAERLRAAGVDPEAPGDPKEAWLELQKHFGRRATLLDRYALEAAARGVRPEELDEVSRDRMTLEVLEAHYPGFKVVSGSERVRRDPIEVVDYDPSWPARFASWRVRLAWQLGRVARRIEHVGSTAVPGLPAKPVIDIMVSVADVEDEAAYKDAIESEGVALRSREEGRRYFRPAGDRPREVQIHVCQAGSEWERTHLLFRDFLRSHVEVCRAYAALKKDLAERYRHDRIAYNDAKTHFILDALARAEAWAAAKDG